LLPFELIEPAQFPPEVLFMTMLFRRDTPENA